MATAGVEQRERLIDDEVGDVDVAEATEKRIDRRARVGSGRGDHGKLHGDQDDADHGPEHESVIRARHVRSQ